jgi:hypothetical protein
MPVSVGIDLIYSWPFPETAYYSEQAYLGVLLVV